jgi:hypothetical protein
MELTRALAEHAKAKRDVAALRDALTAAKDGGERAAAASLAAEQLGHGLATRLLSSSNLKVCSWSTSAPIHIGRILIPGLATRLISGPGRLGERRGKSVRVHR